jgi:signal transduction histidine kinase
VKWLVDGFARRSGIDVRAEIDEVSRLPPDVEVALFRVAQEALTNVYRHSGSRTVTARLFRAGASVTLEVADAGRGIDKELLEQADDQLFTAGLGLAGMRERVRELDGEFDVRSNGGGTIIRATVPCSGVTSA